MTREELIDRLKGIKERAENNLYMGDLYDSTNLREDLIEGFKIYSSAVENLIFELGE